MIRKYLHWLHTQWPAGHVESLPEAREDGATNVRGLFVAGDLRGVPLLKFSVDTGARVVRRIVAEASFPSTSREDEDDLFDIVIIGGGVAGMSAALEARKAGVRFEVLEANEPFSTIVNFPKRKPIYTYPKDMEPAGDLEVTAEVKEALVEELRAQTVEAGIVPRHVHVDSVKRTSDRLEVVVPDGENLRARYVIVALGRSGNFRRLNVPGEELDKVYNRLHDPQDFCDRNALVVGGGDSALETAIALAQCGARVTVSYRKSEFNRPKPENVEQLEALAGDAGAIRLMMASTVAEIRENEVDIKTSGGDVETVPNDVVFSMIGRDPPLDFFRRSRVRIAGEWTKGKVAGLAAFLAFCVLLYNWKSGGSLGNLFYENNWFPVSLKDWFAGTVQNARSLAGVTVISASTPSFWYTLAYSSVVFVFGIRRIRRRRTPYITVQTSVLMAIQIVPLFLLPEIILPYLAKNGWLPTAFLDALFPVVDYGNGREFWRAYGLILAWPLNVYNVFTDQPLGWWLAISFVQTFVLIPGMIYFWGKGAYCGWICSCGALAETLGDGQRHKMPHGPRWNRLNAVGQVVLLVAFVMLIIRVVGWAQPSDAWANRMFPASLSNYKWIVDVTLAGVVGYGVYFWFSGRVWCRFICPLAALMHVYARFSRFRILADKKKCISCNVCTSVCHQGIDVMNFANKGLHMKDPECVRCSACVQSCPTGVLTFGQVDKSGAVIRTDSLPASPVQMRES